MECWLLVVPDQPSSSKQIQQQKPCKTPQGYEVALLFRNQYLVLQIKLTDYINQT